MILNLNSNGPHGGYHFKKYTVLHETGHVLGFYHEHQHPSIGSEGFCDENVVVNDLGKEVFPGDQTKAQVFYDNNFASSMIYQTGFPFDRDSAMMYP